MKPQDYREHIPHNCRRAAFHDYCAPGSYMITISKHPKCPNFSSLIGDPIGSQNPPSVILSEVGEIIKNQIICIADWHYFKIMNFVIMPDHVHILWNVNQYLDHKLGHYIGIFKSRCSTNLAKLMRLRGISNSQSVFVNKYNDMIAFDSEMVERFSNYISDNPRRRLIAIRYSHLFERLQCVQIGDVEMDLFGNFQLLRHPIITPAIISRRYNETERAYWRRAWDETIRSQGVLISPFISEAERELMRLAISEGASIIRIMPDGMPPRFKPQGKDFELCLEGRALFIGPPRLSKKNHILSREECMNYNDMARWIASHPNKMMKLINISRHKS